LPLPKAQTTPMPSQRAIEIFALLNFVIVGISLVYQPLAWAKYFAWMRRNGEGGAVIYGLFCVLWGSLIVSFHREWNGLLVVLPVFGVLQLLEGFVFLVAPEIGLRMMSSFNEANLGLFRLLGIIALVLAAIIFVAIGPMAF
jgi:uncharacterized protein YjeT (DUF2065 family)